MSCPNCPCPEICLGWQVFCEWAAKQPPEPTEISHICGRSRLERSPEYPSLFQQATNAAKAVGAVVASAVRGEAVTVPQEEQDRRLAICHVCVEWFDPSQQRCRHKDCGCFMNFKTRLGAMHCPIGKW